MNNMQIGYLTIDTYPVGARIYIDDILVINKDGEPGLTPALLTITTGYHDIKLTLDGYCEEFGGEYIMENLDVRMFRNFNICW